MPMPAAERVPWTSGRVLGSPEPPPPYVIERALPKIAFREPVDAMLIPGTNRLAVVELRGRLVSVDWNAETGRVDEFGDAKQWNAETVECYSITFHPKFAENRFAFVWFNLDLHGKPNREDGTRVVRFRVTKSDPPRLDMASATEILRTMSGGHNGGNLRFGPDGFLHLGLGDADGPEPPDPKVTGQDISDLPGSVLRIDVDHPSDSRGYSIPADNPFVAQPGAQGEIWAYGFRNPWRLAFSPDGELWLGDVGWELWEGVIRVERGGNYGWSITEMSRQDVRPDRLRGPTPILPPAHAHSHEEAASITGGEFSRSARLPELHGAYIYGDWQMGTFWSLRRESGAVKITELCRSSLMPVGFAVAPDGDVIALDQPGGGLWRFARNPNAGQPGRFPRRLSETGIFADTAAQTPAPGVVPYSVTVARFADGATGTRWIAVPGTAEVTVAQKDLNAIVGGSWLFPKDSVLAKTLTRDGRRLETQLMHFDGLQWGAYSFRWNDGQTDAELVGARGEDAVIAGQPWRFHSRSECLRCHNMRTNFAPGISALLPAAQLREFSATGLAPKNATPLARTESPNLEHRARDYLHANCSTCHRAHGGGSVRMIVESDRPLRDTRLLDPPMLGALGLDDARLVAPGDPARSVILQRMATEGRGHMPYLGSRFVDEAGLTLLRDWISSLPPENALPSSAAERAAERAALAKLRDGDVSALDVLLASASGALEVALALADGSLTGAARAAAVEKGSALEDPLRRDLFERHLPESARRKTLGLTFDRAALAARKGEAAVGASIFRALCAACHRHGSEGREFGPDLSRIAAKYPRIDLIAHIAEPAKVIDPAWNLTVLEMKNGTTHSGFVTACNDADLTLRLADGTAQRIAVSEIAKSTATRVSLMPGGLLAGLTADEAAGLLEFLLKAP
jgi:putative heme-binding domain-containing protein